MRGDLRNNKVQRNACYQRPPGRQPFGVWGLLATPACGSAVFSAGLGLAAGMDARQFCHEIEQRKGSAASSSYHCAECATQSCKLASRTGLEPYFSCPLLHRLQAKGDMRVQIYAQFRGALHNVCAVNGTGKGLVFHLFAY